MHSLVRVSSRFLRSGIMNRAEKDPRMKSAKPVGIETEKSIVTELMKSFAGSKYSEKLFVPTKLALTLKEWGVVGKALKAKVGGSYERKIRTMWSQCDVVMSLGDKTLFGEIKTTIGMHTNVFGLISKHVTSLRMYGNKHVSVVHYPQLAPSSLKANVLVMVDALCSSGMISVEERNEVADNFFILSFVKNPFESNGLFKKLGDDRRSMLFVEMRDASSDEMSVDVLRRYGMYDEADINFEEWDRLLGVVSAAFCV